MNAPPFLIGAALLFWGHQTGIWYPALLMALVLEGARRAKSRFDFGDSDYSRFWDLCNILFAAAAFYCFVNRDGNNALMALFQTSLFEPARNSDAAQVFFIFFQWWPMIFFPMAAAQAFGSREQIPATVFVWLLRPRKQVGTNTYSPELSINVGYPYLGVVLLSAGAANRRDPWFYLGFCFLTGIALWATQPRRFKMALWLCLLALVAKLGFWGHIGLNRGQAALENAVSVWVSRYAGRSVDPLESSTAIGRFGRLKLSGAILLKAESEGGMPALLRDSSFTHFNSPQWSVTNRVFNAITQDVDIATWPLLPLRPNSHEIRLSGFFSKLSGILPVPHGTEQIENLPDAMLSTNHFGAIRASGGADFFRCRARYNRGRTLDSPPESADLVVPKLEEAAIDRVYRQLSIDGLKPAQKVRAIDSFFSTNFYYTTYLSNRSKRHPTSTALATFLDETHAGHCEYFATATVLLLRRAGIPARYATGFSIQEPDRGKPGVFIIRGRHAHAWCIYYSAADRAWREIDTTPGTWLQEEQSLASGFEPLRDFFTRGWFRFNQWRYGDKGNFQNYAYLALAAMTAFLLFRLLHNKRRTRVAADGEGGEARVLWPGADSDFYRIERHLESLGLSRGIGETLAAWLERISRSPEVAVGPLQPILELHYRYRFDPQGITAAERDQLRAAVQTWIEDTRKTPAAR